MYMKVDSVCNVWVRVSTKINYSRHLFTHVDDIEN